MGEISKGCVFDGEFESTSGSDLSMRGVISFAKENKLKSETGDIYLNASKNKTSHKALQNSENLLWVRFDKTTAESTTYTPCSFTGEVLILKANAVVVEKIYGQTLDFAKRLKLPEGTEVTYRELRNQYFYDHKSKGMPSQGVMVLAAIAITIATDGAGSALLNGLGLAGESFAAQMVATGLNAAITGTANLAARSLMQNQGDPKKALKAMGQKEALKSLATQVLSANVLHGLSDVLDISSEASSLMESCKYNLSRCLIDTTLQTVIHKEKFRKAFKRSIVDALVDTVANSTTHSLGVKKDGGKISGVQHKAMQAGIGAAAGLASRGKKGVAAGAIGSLFATLVADVYKKPDIDKLPKDQKGIKEFISTRIGRIKLIATAMTLFAGVDVSVASRMAGIYLDNAYKNSLETDIAAQDKARALREAKEAKAKEERLAKAREQAAERRRAESLFQEPMEGDLGSVPSELREDGVYASPVSLDDEFWSSAIPKTKMSSKYEEREVRESIFDDSYVQEYDVFSESGYGDDLYADECVSLYVAGQFDNREPGRDKQKTPYEQMSEAMLGYYREEAAGASQNTKDFFRGISDARKKFAYGRDYALKRTAQGFAQLALEIGVTLNHVSPQELRDFTEQSNRYQLAYERHPFSNSFAAQAGRYTTEFVKIYAGGMFARFQLGSMGINYTPGLVGGSAIGGGVLFGLEPTWDGRLSTRFQNTAFGAGVGAAGAYGLDKIAKGTGNVALNLAKRWDAYKSSLLQPKLGSEFITTHSGEITRTFTPAFNHDVEILTWQHAFNKAQKVGEFPFAPGSVGAGKVWTSKSRIKAVKLPAEGKIRFVPLKGYQASNPIRKGPKNGYIDRFGNEWIPGPSRTQGQQFEWDVQLSDLGKMKLGWASRDGRHINVSLDGRLTHR